MLGSEWSTDFKLGLVIPKLLLPFLPTPRLNGETHDKGRMVRTPWCSGLVTSLKGHWVIISWNEHPLSGPQGAQHLASCAEADIPFA